MYTFSKGLTRGRGGALVGAPECGALDRLSGFVRVSPKCQLVTKLTVGHLCGNLLLEVKILKKIYVSWTHSEQNIEQNINRKIASNKTVNTTDGRKHRTK